MKFNLHIVILLFIILLAVQENSFSVARRVKKVMAADIDCFSLPKETVAVERFARKLTAEATNKAKSSKKAVSHSLGNRKGEEEEEDNSIMAFSSDYHPPKPHPPKNN